MDKNCCFFIGELDGGIEGRTDFAEFLMTLEMNLFSNRTIRENRDRHTV